MTKSFTFDDVLLIPQYNEIESRKDVNLSVTDKTGKLKLDLPVFSSNMDTITESAMCNYIHSKGGMGVMHRFMDIPKNVEEMKKSEYSFASVGLNGNEMERYHALLDLGVRTFNVDVAHGHSRKVAETIKYMKDKKSGIIVMAGNVCTLEGAEFLRDAGADLIKVGIGPSPVCRTRGATGFGYPQLSAIQECAEVKGVSIVADGGIKSPGDIVKALAFGADFVMIGSMLAGTHYTPGKIYVDDGHTEALSFELEDIETFKVYRGMASREANEDMFGELADHKTFEGVSTTVSYKNEKETNAIMQDIIGGIRSGLTYCGAKNIKELQEKAEYTFVSNSTKQENKTLKD